MTFLGKFRSYRGVTVRNIKVYMKDKMSIILSLLTQVIVLGLYLLFLKDNYVDSIRDSLGELVGIINDDDIQALANSWLLSGVLGTSVVTVALNSLSVMVSDKQNRIDYDCKASPVGNGVIVLSYFSGAVVNTFIMSAIMLTAGLVFMAAGGALYLSALEILQAYALVALGSVSAALILMLVASFIKKSSTLGSLSALVSAAIGFVIGAYIPVSQFGTGVQTAVNLVPASHVAGLFRNVIMTPSIDNISDKLNGMDNGAFATAMREAFSLDLNIFGDSRGISFMLAYSLIVAAVFLVLNLIMFRFSSKRKD